ncbi:MAG: Rpn family recombination-promoting nuclease/putative transposase [Spirosomaceae bacterium]|nr:Rpn family recombination-promoting nuclease/putative transposase [Spirosomataceae bacterium]
MDNIHDKYFKDIFSQPQMVRELAYELLPTDLVESLNLDSLVLDNSSYINENLSENFADLVYSVETKRQKPLKIVLLLEHKSYQERYPHLQLLKYLIEVWDKDKSQKKELTTIIPIIFYHGKSRWKYQPMGAYFVKSEDFYLRYIPDFNYHLIDLSVLPNVKIIGFKDKFLALSTLILKYSRIKNYLNVIFDELKVIFSDDIEEQNRLNSTFIYIYYTSKLELDEIVDIFNKVSPKISEYAMTPFQRELNRSRIEGKMEGRMEGKIEGKIEEQNKAILALHKKGMAESFIAEIFGISTTRVKEVIESIKL